MPWFPSGETRASGRRLRCLSIQVIPGDRPRVARNAAMGTLVIRTMWAVTGTAIADSYHKIWCREPRGHLHPSLEDFLQRSPINFVQN